MIFTKTVIDTLEYELPESAISSAEIEDQLDAVYQKLKLPKGRIELMTGILKRRFWKNPVKPSEAAAAACKKALNKSSIDPKSIDLLIFTSVCRDQLEPSTASTVHSILQLGGQTHFFDLSNACLGFLDAMAMAAGLIEAGSIKTALICSGENGYPLLKNTINILKKNNLNRKAIKPFFANLTIGSAACAGVLCEESLAKNNTLRITSASQMTDSLANTLCQGGSDYDNDYFMQTDSEALMESGIRLAQNNFKNFLKKANWDTGCPDHYVCHQVGKRHQQALYESLNIDISKDYSTYAHLGNTGSASLPVTLAQGLHDGVISPESKIALLGIGSGLASTMIAINGN